MESQNLLSLLKQFLLQVPAHYLSEIFSLLEEEKLLVTEEARAESVFIIKQDMIIIAKKSDFIDFFIFILLFLTSLLIKINLIKINSC